MQQYHVDLIYKKKGHLLINKVAPVIVLILNLFCCLDELEIDHYPVAEHD